MVNVEGFVNGTMTEIDYKMIKEKLNDIEINQKEMRQIMEKKWKIKQNEDEGDENEKRGNWSNQFEFMLSCLGFAVGLGNVWRFPYLCFKNGGGAFLIPYLIMLVVVGMPVFLLELTLGQFSSQGPLTCWEFSPIFKGLGIGMSLVSILGAIYYNVIIAWALYYLFASFSSPLPWEKCGNWSDIYCVDVADLRPTDNCTSENNLVSHDDGSCFSLNNNKFIGVWNKTIAEKFGIKRQTPAQEYLNYVGLQVKKADGFNDLGPLRWDMSLCLLLAWLITFLSMYKGIKSSGKVVYFTAIFPYVVLVILFINGFLHPGYEKGIYFFLTPDLSILSKAEVWKDAATQIFFSLSVAIGGLTTLASYNKFKTDVVRDTLIITLANCATSFFAGIVIFSYIGHLADKLDLPVSEVADSGVGLAFTVYPFAMTQMPGATFWSILFFLMLITLGLDSQFAMMETITTGCMDQFPKTRPKKTYVILICCIVGFFLGLPMCTPGGPYLLTMMDDYAGGWNIMLVCILECVAVSYVYGGVRFCKDIQVMTTKTVCGCIPWYIFKWWWMACWYCFAPILVTFIMIFSWYSYEASVYEGYVFPVWVNSLGWLMSLSVLVAIFIPMIVMCVINKRLGKEMSSLVRPTKFWGPALVKFRQEITYVPNFVIDPFNEDSSLADGSKLTTNIPEIPPNGLTGEINHVFDLSESENL